MPIAKALPQKRSARRRPQKGLCRREKDGAVRKRRRGTLKNAPEKDIMKTACVVKKLSKKTPQIIGAKEKEHRYDLFT